MAFNFLIRSRSAATCSMIPLLRRSVENPCFLGVPFLRFSSSSTTATYANDNNIANLIESFFKRRFKPDYGNKALTDYPFEIMSSYRSTTILTRKVDLESTDIVLHRDTYKVNNGNWSISINASVLFDYTYLTLEFEAILEPKMIRIQSVEISDNPLDGHLSFFEEYLGTRGINASNLGVLFNFFKEKKYRNN